MQVLQKRICLWRSIKWFQHNHIYKFWLEKKKKKRHGIDTPLLASSVPYLRLDGLVIDDECLRLELDTNSGLRIRTELVPGKTSQQLGLSHGRVSDQHHLEHVVDLLVIISVQVRHPQTTIKSLSKKGNDTFRSIIYNTYHIYIYIWKMLYERKRKMGIEI